jgi:hypothetical protein
LENGILHDLRPGMVLRVSVPRMGQDAA